MLQTGDQVYTKINIQVHDGYCCLLTSRHGLYTIYRQVLCDVLPGVRHASHGVNMIDDCSEGAMQCIKGDVTGLLYHPSRMVRRQGQETTQVLHPEVRISSRPREARTLPAKLGLSLSSDSLEVGVRQCFHTKAADWAGGSGLREEVKRHLWGSTAALHLLQH